MRGDSISVVIPCFNDGAFVGETAGSAAGVADEIIVVDDGSTDPGTVEALARLEAKGITVVRIPHSGPSAARNAGFERAQGRYVLPLDADNRLNRDFVPAAKKLLERSPDLGAIYGDVRLFGERDGLVRPGQVRLERLLSLNTIDTSALMRRELWRDCGGYDPELPGWEDWELWLSAIEGGWKLAYLPMVATEYRVRPNGVNARLQDHAQLRRDAVRHVVRKHAQLFAHHVRHVPRGWAGLLAEAAHEREATRPGSVDPVVLAALRPARAKGVEWPAPRPALMVRAKALRLAWSATDFSRRAHTALRRPART